MSNFGGADTAGIEESLTRLPPSVDDVELDFAATVVLGAPKNDVIEALCVVFAVLALAVKVSPALRLREDEDDMVGRPHLQETLRGKKITMDDDFEGNFRESEIEIEIEIRISLWIGQ